MIQGEKARVATVARPRSRVVAKAATARLSRQAVLRAPLCRNDGTGNGPGDSRSRVA
jgi:hypothetical protein